MVYPRDWPLPASCLELPFAGINQRLLVHLNRARMVLMAASGGTAWHSGAVRQRLYRWAAASPRDTKEPLIGVWYQNNSPPLLLSLHIIACAKQEQSGMCKDAGTGHRLWLTRRYTFYAPLLKLETDIACLACDQRSISTTKPLLLFLLLNRKQCHLLPYLYFKGIQQN